MQIRYQDVHTHTHTRQAHRKRETQKIDTHKYTNTLKLTHRHTYMYVRLLKRRFLCDKQGREEEEEERGQIESQIPLFCLEGDTHLYTHTDIHSHTHTHMIAHPHLHEGGRIVDPYQYFTRGQAHTYSPPPTPLSLSLSRLFSCLFPPYTWSHKSPKF